MATRALYHPAEFLKRLYDWVVNWAETRHAKTALFCIALAESSFFPIPPDVLLVAMGVGASRKALHFALICLVGSVLGGALGYWIGMEAWGALSPFFYQSVPGFSPQVFDRVAILFQENAFWAVFAAGFSPIPYKVFTVAAGATQVDFTTFILASILGRGLRFFGVGLALRLFGAPVRVFIEKYFDRLSLLLVVLGVLGFVTVKYLI